MLASSELVSAAKHVRTVDVLFHQQFLVRRITVEDYGVGEKLGYAACAPVVTLDELHLVVRLERLGEAEADVAAAGDHHPLHRILCLAHLAHHQTDVLASGEEKYLVAVLDHGIAPRHDALAIAVDRRHARVGVRDMLAQRAQLLTHEQAAAQCTDADQAHLAVGKIEDLQRARVMDQLFDVFGDQLLGADPHVDCEPALGEEAVTLEVVAGADAGDLGRRAIQRERDLAGEHVDFIARSERHDDVGIGRSRRFQHARIGGVAVDGADVEAVLQVAQRVLVGVDHRDLVRLFARQVIRGGATHLAGAEDDDLHMSSRFA